MDTREASEGRLPLPAGSGPLERIRGRLGCDGHRTLCWSVAAAAFAALLIALVWTVTFERVRYERQDAIDDALRENSNLTLALEEHTMRTLKGVEQALRYLKHEYQEEGRRFDLPGLIERGALGDSLFHFIGVVDARGRLVASSSPSARGRFDDRDYFRAHTATRSGIFIGRPISGRLTGRTSIPVSLRLDDRDGSFAGVVYVGIDPAYFTGFYQKSDLGENGVVTLVRTDGVTLARRAGQQGTFGQDMSGSTLMAEQAKRPSGTFFSRGKLEGVPRFYSYRTLQDFPLIVALGTSQAETLREFEQRRRNYYVVASIATAFALVFTVVSLLLLLRQRYARDRLRESQEQFEQLAHHIPEAFWITDAARDELIYVSPAYEQVSGRRFSSPQTAWEEWKAAIHYEDRDRALAAYRRMFDSNLDVEYRLVRPDGTVRWVHVRGFRVRNANGEVYRVAGTVADITEQRELQDRLQRQAHYDALTGLPNRVLCFDRLKQAIGQAKRKKWNVSFMFLDLDRFKPVNDTLGHDAGDALLVQAGQRLSEAVRGGDTVARIGGDEFGVVLSELAHAQDAAIVAHKILDTLAKPFHLKGHDVFVSASIGIASYPSDSEDPDELVKNADAALFRAKLLGRNNHQFYTAEMNARALEKLQRENQLRQALERKEFLLHFQPKIDLATGEATGTEALLRWQPPGNGLVPPLEFIPILEESGLIVPVGEWVLQAACAQVRAWQRAGLGSVPVAVNLSAKQFQRHDLCASVTRALSEAGIDPALLELEITESAAMESPEDAVRTLHELHRLGVRLSIDDFGTGYSSLAYLKRFPVDTLKIDRSFVIGLPSDGDDVSIARAVIAMAHSLDMTVIAEGVETEGQRGFLSVNGCDEIQGYLISRPLPPEDCAQVLRKRMRPAAHRREPDGASLAV
jgi:diguanylate cyclase (GGDEF)-like protein/PAS domain S-box-containing protein